jgi:hypothetical protein
MTSLAHDIRSDSSISGLLSTIIGTAAGRIEDKVDSWTDDLNDIAHGDKPDLPDLGEMAGEGLGKAAEGGSATRQAGLKGAQASLQGKNPVWAALKGAWSGGGAVVRAAIVTSVVAAILLLVVSPVLLIVFLLSLLIIAAVHRAMRSGHR